METVNDNPRFKEWLQEILRTGEATVTFIKKDGTEREMRCTVSPDLIPQDPNRVIKEDQERRVNPDVLPVYDLDKGAWRSFRWDSVKMVFLGHRPL